MAAERLLGTARADVAVGVADAAMIELEMWRPPEARGTSHAVG
jgi:hypothetical protein